MGRKNKSSKAAEKKRDRLAMEKLMNGRLQFVKAANEQEDPLEALPSFRKYSKNDLSVSLTTERSAALSEETKQWLMALLTTNMKDMYEDSDWGWNEKNKREEMMEEAAWYLIARDEKGSPVGFSHFRYDMDYDDEVLYVYEIQLEDVVRRKGLGKFMMQVLELLAFKADMRKIMLTVFKHNESAKKFFMDSLKFEKDETSPVDDVYEQFDYSIISKFNKRKLAREEQEKAQEENTARVANVQV